MVGASFRLCDMKHESGATRREIFYPEFEIQLSGKGSNQTQYFIE